MTSAPRPGARSGLGPGWVAFIVVDVILIAVVGFMALTVFGGGDDEPTQPGAATTQEAAEESEPAETTTSGDSEPTTPAPDRPGGTPTTVASPSRNITCTIDADGARCGIAELASAPAPVDSCDGTIGYVYQVGADGITTPCVSRDDRPVPAGSNVAVLDYGQSVQQFGFTCESAETGMSCSDDATGRGFRLARAGASTF